MKVEIKANLRQRFQGTVDNQALTSLHGGSLKITLTVPSDKKRTKTEQENSLIYYTRLGSKPVSSLLRNVLGIYLLETPLSPHTSFFNQY